MATKNKKINYLTIIICSLIISAILMFFVRLLVGNSINVENKEIVDLYNYVGNEDLYKCNGLVTYGDKLIKYDDISDGERLCIAYTKTNIKKKDYEDVVLKKDKSSKVCTLDNNIKFATDDYKDKKCTLKKYNKDVINKTYEKIFGHSVEDNINVFNIDGYNICYLYKDSYYCGLSETFSFTVGNESLIYKVINKAVEKRGNIIIYDYLVKINDNKCYKSYIDNTINDKCTKNYNSKEEMSYKFLKKNGTLYKHVFKKLNNNDYYSWISSEPVK